MSEYTSPRIADHLRRLARDVAYTEGHASVMRAAAAEMDRLAAHDREVAAKALRDAAGSPIPRGALATGTRAWLRDRADQIEEGSNDK